MLSFLSASQTTAAASGQAEILNRLIRLEGGVGASDLADNEDSQDVFDYMAGAVVQGHFASGTELFAGARFLGYNTSISNGDASSSLFAPVAHVNFPLSSAARVYAGTDPRIERQTVWTFSQENPFAYFPFVAPNVHTVDAEGGVEVRSNRIGVKAYGGLTISPTRAFFERDPGSGLFQVEYGKARTMEGGVDITVLGPAGIEFSAGGALRDGMLTEFDEALPYFASSVGRVGAQIPFAEGKGRIGAAAYFEGERPADRAESRTLPAYGRLTIDGAYDFWNGVSVVVRGERLLGRAEQWEGFPQASYSFMGGIRFVR